ncbi:chromatin binding protein [Pichia californica]|uniref:Chromatin binding protein n=1 Tax=Pichia californica TaxID=460514 RepID=A0A9P7BFQ8_9ASCO|nr:chromatin binding protein [[Candida] californica]KAG0688385.1 chromatin binding protein [[Candida] californica]
MNLSLHDPQFITADFPTTLNMTLSYGHCTSLQISPCGHYIASGLLNGAVLIIDTWSNNVTSILQNHSMPIVGLKWIYYEDQTNDQFDDDNIVVGLVSWSRDWKVCLNGLKKHTMKLEWECTFPGGIWNVDIINTGRINPISKVWQDWKLIICKVEGGICFVKYNKEYLENQDSNKCIIPLNDNDREIEGDEGYTLCCCNFFGGRYVITGTSKGWLQIIDVIQCKILKCFKACNGNIKGICIVERGFYEENELKFGSHIVPISRMIVNSSDRILRQYDISNWYELGDNIEDWKFDIEQKYQDVVNRIQWNTVKFSPTGEYVCASTQSGGGAAHDVYVWETSMGSLVQILEGAHEELIDVDWGMRSSNGNVCCISANGMDSGTIYMWGVRAPQKWSALAPDFEEIEQNIEYIENEDEFDMVGAGGNILNEDGIEIDKTFEKIKIVDVVSREDTDARGFRFIRGCIIDTNLDN